MDEMFNRLATVDWAAVGIFWIVILAGGPLVMAGVCMLMEWMDNH